MTFFINLWFSRLDKFDGPIFERVHIREGGGGGAIFGMLIGLHIWEGAYIRGGVVYNGGAY